MNKKVITEAVFLTSILVIFIVAVIIGPMDKGKDSDGVPAAQKGISTYHQSTLPTLNTNSTSSNVVDASTTSDKYEMSEPFALKVRGYGNPMLNPAMWMNPMTWMNPANYMNLMHPSTWMNPANYMQMMNPMAYMSMMYPMMGMMNPTAMMNPMMGGNLAGNTQIGGLSNPTISIPNVMNPEQYEEWYNKQQEKLNESN